MTPTCSCPTDKVDGLTERVAKLETHVENHQTLHADTKQLLEEVKKSMDALTQALAAQQAIMADAKSMLEGYQKLRGAWSIVSWAGDGLQALIRYAVAVALAATILRAASTVDLSAVTAALLGAPK